MTPDPTRLAWAALAVLAWLATIALVAWTVRRARLRETARADALIGPGEPTLVAFASQTGFAEELAWMTARALSDAGAGARVVSFADLDLPTLQAAKRALFIVSTTGEGDAPDTTARFARQAMAAPADLSHLTYGLMALGDRTYRDYCAFGHALDAWLRSSAATPLFDPVEVDDGDPAAVRHWQHHLNQLTGATAAPDWAPPAYDRWRLVERRLLNPGSPGGPAWHLALEPIDHSPTWVAGDIAEIGIPATGAAPAPGHREYSVASLPSDGRAEFLIRLMHRPDGSPGLASGWLTGQAAIGDTIPMRIRVNRGFHAPDPATPLILIGNGTGLAGLRAHLKARALAPSPGDTWLLFGERTRAHDAFYDAELSDWSERRILTRLDRAFSRDGGPRYVQDLIPTHADALTQWVDRGATLLVCGSLEGMASGVQTALETALGRDRLTALTEDGRYRRDVY